MKIIRRSDTKTHQTNTPYSNSWAKPNNSYNSPTKKSNNSTSTYDSYYSWWRTTVIGDIVITVAIILYTTGIAWTLWITRHR